LDFVVPETPRDRYGEELVHNITLLEEFGEIRRSPLQRKYRMIWKDKEALEKLLTSFQNYIVLSYAGYAGKLCRLLFKENKIPILYHVPQCIDIIRRPFWQRPIESFFEHHLSKYATCYISCSKNEQNLLVNKFGINVSKIITIPNYIVRDGFAKQLSKNYSFATLGRVSKDKRVGSILKIAKGLGILDEFIIIGDGPELKFLKQKFPEAHFTGHIDNDQVSSLLLQTKFIVSNSIIEGLPFAIIEAMHAGVVPIISDISAHRDLITGSQDGYFFKDESDLANILLEALVLEPDVYDIYSKNVIKNIQSLSKLSQTVFVNHFIKYMEKEVNKIYLGVYGIYLQDDQVLVIKKARGPYVGKYDLPGGGLNFEETVDRCLERELFEETNTQVLNKVLVGINEYQCRYTKEDGTLKDFHHLGIYYKVNLLIKDLKTTPDGQDSNGAIFIPISDLTNENTSTISLPMIKKSFEFNW